MTPCLQFVSARRYSALVLEGLDEVGWADLSHAYGSAGDVPALLRQAGSGGDVAGEAISELYGRLFHQGTVCPATGAAVPFLVELARWAPARRGSLLPDGVRVVGGDHPHTFIIRARVASLTGECGNEAEALRMSLALLLDQNRVLGPDHFITRSHVAGWTDKCGDAAEALRLFQALLLDEERVLGPDHPSTLATRDSIAYWTQMRDEQTGQAG